MTHIFRSAHDLRRKGITLSSVCLQPGTQAFPFTAARQKVLKEMFNNSPPVEPVLGWKEVRHNLLCKTSTDYPKTI